MAKTESSGGRHFLINWDPDDLESARFTFDQIEEARKAIEESDHEVGSFTTDCEHLSEAVRLLSPLAVQEMDEWTEIDGHTMRVVATGDGVLGFLPQSDHPDAESLARGSASWLPGGPCVFDQYEEIYRLGNMYWVEAQGDNASALAIAGWFDDPAEGLRAAAEASQYFTVLPNGKLACELDEWPQDE